jgi:hypothetical protein
MVNRKKTPHTHTHTHTHTDIYISWTSKITAITYLVDLIA